MRWCADATESGIQDQLAGLSLAFFSSLQIAPHCLDKYDVCGDDYDDSYSYLQIKSKAQAHWRSIVLEYDDDRDDDNYDDDLMISLIMMMTIVCLK